MPCGGYFTVKSFDILLFVFSLLMSSPTPTSSVLELRSDLLLHLMSLCKDSEHGEAPSPSTTASTSSSFASSPSTVSLPQQFIRYGVGVTNPSWAMEEYMRLCSNPEVWGRSALAHSVWSPPATPDCPFGTQRTDFHVQHVTP